MAKKKYEETNIQAIAEAIREKTGTEQTYKASEMANGVNEVYDKGRTDQNKALWKGLTYSEITTGYQAAFGASWHRDIFYPAHNIRPQRIDYGFYCFNSRIDNEIFDLEARLQSCGVILDLSRCINMELTFAYANISRLGVLDCRKNTRWGLTFMYCKIETLDKLILNSEGDQTIGNAFSSCYTLQNITVEGVIGRTTTFQHSPLTPESMKSIISCLKDYSTENTGVYTITFKEDCWTALEADSSAPDGGTWKDYVRSLGWLI